MNTDQENSKARTSYFELKSIAKSIGHPSLFASKRRPTPKKTPKTQIPRFSPASLTEVFEQEEEEFDFEDPPEITDLPDLDSPSWKNQPKEKTWKKKMNAPNC